MARRDRRQVPRWDADAWTRTMFDVGGAVRPAHKEAVWALEKRIGASSTLQALRSGDSTARDAYRSSIAVLSEFLLPLRDDDRRMFPYPDTRQNREVIADAVRKLDSCALALQKAGIWDLAAECRRRAARGRTYLWRRPRGKPVTAHGALARALDGELQDEHFDVQDDPPSTLLGTGRRHRLIAALVTEFGRRRMTQEQVRAELRTPRIPLSKRRAGPWISIEPSASLFAAYPPGFKPSLVEAAGLADDGTREKKEARLRARQLAAYRRMSPQEKEAVERLGAKRGAAALRRLP